MIFIDFLKIGFQRFEQSFTLFWRQLLFAALDIVHGLDGATITALLVTACNNSYTT